MVCESLTLDMKCTHLIVGQPNRSGKVLAALAAGIWVLKMSFVEACIERQCLVNEVDHVWNSFGVINGIPTTLKTPNKQLIFENWTVYYHFILR